MNKILVFVSIFAVFLGLTLVGPAPSAQASTAHVIVNNTGYSTGSLLVVQQNKYTGQNVSTWVAPGQLLHENTTWEPIMAAVGPGWCVLYRTVAISWTSQWSGGCGGSQGTWIHFANVVGSVNPGQPVEIQIILDYHG